MRSRGDNLDLSNGASCGTQPSGSVPAPARRCQNCIQLQDAQPAPHSTATGWWAVVEGLPGPRSLRSLSEVPSEAIWVRPRHRLRVPKEPSAAPERGTVLGADTGAKVMQVFMRKVLGARLPPEPNEFNQIIEKYRKKERNSLLR